MNQREFEKNVNRSLGRLNTDLEEHEAKMEMLREESIEALRAELRKALEQLRREKETDKESRR